MRFAHPLVLFFVWLLSACSTLHSPKAGDNAAAEANALVPDYALALQTHPTDYIAFIKAWFEGTQPEVDAADIVRYSFVAKDQTAEEAAQKLVAGNEAFCEQIGGTVVKDPPALTCAAPDGKAIARLSVQVFHANAEQPATLQFTGESATWMSRLKEERMADYRQVLDTLAGNGIRGSVLLSSGESFDAVRFGRLSRSDFYALKTPNHGLVLFSDIVSVKWSELGLSVVERDGDKYDDLGQGLTPRNTIVRLHPTADGNLQAESLTGEEPFRFVYLDPKNNQPRQARLRGDAQILQITISPKPSRFRGGLIETRFDKKEREGFRKSLVAEARKTASKSGKSVDHVDLEDAKVQADLDQIGRVGPCTRAQSEDRLRSGDVAFSEYLVCAQYRQEAQTVKANGGKLTADKTPLLLLGRAARAPWYDFNGVLR